MWVRGTASIRHANGMAIYNYSILLHADNTDFELIYADLFPTQRGEADNFI